MSAEAEVRNASTEFYAALNRMANGDAGSLSDVWSHGDRVTAMHPIGGRQIGWDAVRESFEQVAGVAADGDIRLEDQVIRVYGDTALEVGNERGSFTLGGDPVEIDHRVTNVYQRDDGAWKIVHHHTDTSPAMLDVLGRMQPPAD